MKFKNAWNKSKEFPKGMKPSKKEITFSKHINYLKKNKAKKKRSTPDEEN